MGLNLDHDYHRVFNYGFSHLEKSLQDLFLTKEKAEDIVEIGSDVWIGKNVYIKNNVHIDHGAVVASNSYVVSDVPAYAIVGGNPARIIKYRFDKEIIEKLLEIAWWDWADERIDREMRYFNNPLEFISRSEKGDGDF